MSDLLLDSAVDWSIRVTVLAAAVGLVLALFRIRSSSTRHAVWTAVLMAMLLMPLIVRIVPGLQVRVPDAVAQIMPATSLVDIEGSPLAGEQLTGRTEAAPPTPSAAVTNPAPTALPEPAGETPIRWSAVALVVYFLGAAFLLVRLLVGTFHLFRIRRSSRPVVVTSAAGQILESALVATPVTIGLFAPRVVLPLTWREWTPGTMAAVLAHERAHAARRDPLVAMLARVNCAVFCFHPLAWWIERKLATLAEHVCDDAAVREVTRRSYAETLLDIAAMVRRHNGRIVWQGVGVDGDGRLGQRIDRVLAGTTVPAPSRARRLLVAASCAAVTTAVVACRQETSVPPLREDPELAAQLKLQADRQAFDQQAQAMTLEEAGTLERALEQNPEDMVAREKLLTFYRWTGKNQQPWNANVAARRRHALWLIRHHPDSDLVWSVRLSKREDPEGYAQGRAIWLAAIDPRDVSEKTLSHAAWFFEESEKQMAENILLRAKAQYPGGPRPRTANGIYYSPWSARLGELYASAMAGKVGPYRQTEEAAVQAWGRDKLERSNDGQELYSAGIHLVYWPAGPGQREFGRRLIERASQLDSPATESARAWLRRGERVNRLEGPLTENAAGAERMRQLAARAEVEYMNAEYSDWRARQSPDHLEYSGNPDEDRKKAAEAFGRSQAYAREALELAPSWKNAPEYPSAVFRAHIAAGLNALRQGNRPEAVKQLLNASKVPPPAEPASEPRSLLEYRLVNYLLKHGERAAIIEYLERGAPGREQGQREKMLKEAAAIREGRMPEQYQRLLASGSL